MADLVVHEEPTRVVETDPHLRIPDRLRGIAMPEGPTEAVQAQIDALDAKMTRLGILEPHWMNKGFGVGCFSLAEVAAQIDEIGRIVQGRAGHILETTSRRVQEPLCIETVVTRRLQVES